MNAGERQVYICAGTPNLVTPLCMVHSSWRCRGSRQMRDGYCEHFWVPTLPCITITTPHALPMSLKRPHSYSFSLSYVNPVRIFAKLAIFNQIAAPLSLLHIRKSYNVPPRWLWLCLRPGPPMKDRRARVQTSDWLRKSQSLSLDAGFRRRCICHLWLDGDHCLSNCLGLL